MKTLSGTRVALGFGLAAALMSGASQTAWAQSDWTGTWENKGQYKKIELIQSDKFVYGEIDDKSFLQGKVSADGKTLRGYVEASDPRQDGYFEFAKGDPSRRIGVKLAEDPANFTGAVWTTRNYTALKRWPVGERPGDTGIYARFTDEARPTIESFSTRRRDPNRPAGRPTLAKFLQTVTDPEGRAWLSYEVTDFQRDNAAEFEREMEANSREIAEQRAERSRVRLERRKDRQDKLDTRNAMARNLTYNRNLATLPTANYKNGAFRPTVLEVRASSIVNTENDAYEGDSEIFGFVTLVASCEWSNGAVREDMVSAGQDSAYVPLFSAKRSEAAGDSANLSSKDAPRLFSTATYNLRDCFDNPAARIVMRVESRLREKDNTILTDDSTDFYGYTFALEDLPFPSQKSMYVTARKGDARFKITRDSGPPQWTVEYESPGDEQQLYAVIGVTLK